MKLNFTFSLQEGSSSFKVLHLSDVHMDLSYKPGTDSKCGKPLCCTNTTAMTDDPNKVAGYWGNYNCDLPYWTFEDMLWHIKEAHGEVSLVLRRNFNFSLKVPLYVFFSFSSVGTGVHNGHWRLSCS